MAETKTTDRATTAHDMIKAEADHLEKRLREDRGGSLHEAKKADIDYRRGKLDGLRQAEGLLGEGN